MRPILWFAAALAVAGCDVQAGAGAWQPVAANDANLRVMVADPDDLVTGVADSRADGQVVAAAVARYRAGKVRDLPDVSISKVAPISINTGSSAAAAGTQ